MRFVAAFLFVAITGGAAFGESIDNPRYASWAKCKPGTQVVLKTGDGKAGGNEATLTETLVEVTPEKCVVEMARDAAGAKPFKHNIDIEKTITDEDQIKEFKDVMAHADNQTLTTPAGTFKCKHFKSTREGGSTTEVWFCEDVPGGTVKTISEIIELHKTIAEELQSVTKK
jgi:hypothetical protein